MGCRPLPAEVELPEHWTKQQGTETLLQAGEEVPSPSALLGSQPRHSPPTPGLPTRVTSSCLVSKVLTAGLLPSAPPSSPSRPPSGSGSGETHSETSQTARGLLEQCLAHSLWAYVVASSIMICGATQMLALPHAELQTPVAWGAWDMHVAWAITQVFPPHTHTTVCMGSQNEAPQGETDSGLLLCDLPESVFSSANWAGRAAGGSEGARVSPLPVGHVRGQLATSG